jgi:hypothetical protein
MGDIAPLSMLLRSQTDLPMDFKMGKNEFRDGWSFARKQNARRLQTKVEKRGWHFIKVGDVLQGSGVGETEQAAIACALRLALRRVNDFFNAVEINHIELARYPWFVLATVRLCRYRIQADAVLSIVDETVVLPVRSTLTRMSVRSVEELPGFCDTMPLLKEMLVLPRQPEPQAN